MSSTPLTLERYAEMRAEMEAGRLRDDVLVRAGVSVDAWTAEQRRWLEQMGAELERGRLELTNRYTQAFIERQRALQALDPPAPPAKAKPLPGVESTAPLPIPMLAGVPSAPVPFTAARPHESQASPPRVGALASIASEMMAAIAAMPEGIPADTTLPIPPLAHAPATAKSSLPFKSPSPADIARASPVAAPSAPPSVPQLDVLTAAVETADLTDVMEQVRHLKKGVLPFRATAEPQAGDPDDAPTLNRSSSPTAAQPPARLPPPELPTLTAYAQICAELRLDPSRASVIRARHGLAEDSVWGAALRYWQAELNTPAIYEHWTRLVEQMMHIRGPKR